MTRREALAWAASQLAAAPALRDTAAPDAALLLLHALDIPRVALLAAPAEAVPEDRLTLFRGLVQRRLRSEPIQYITGRQDFYGLTLSVTPAALIPRPETELLVESVLAELRRRPPPPPLRVLDVGTGSGAIAIALATHLPEGHVTAADLSPEALALAARNAASHGVTGRLRLLRSDLLAELLSLRPAPRFDVIVSNPPYVPLPDAPSLQPQVRDFEPALALFAGHDGLDIYRRLIPQAHAALAPGGLLAMEIGFAQSAAVLALLTGWDDVRVENDLAGIPRVVLARLPV